MLEPTARSGPARRLAWRRGDVVVHTPLLLARPAAGAILAGRGAHGILAGSSAPAAEDRPLVVVAGGFVDAPLERVQDAWAEVVVPRAARMEAQLALAQPLPRPAGSPPQSSTGAGVHETAAPGNGAATGSPQAAGLVVLGDEIALVPGAAALAGDGQRLASLLVAARRAAGPARMLYAPATGLVHHAALLVYAGVDLLDTLAVERASLQGLYCTPEGAFEAAGLKAPLCACTACTGTAPQAMPREMILKHNLHALADELVRVAGHIENDTLRALVETRARAHPATAATLRRLDAWRDAFTAGWPLVGRGTLHATTLESLSRPDVARFRDRLRSDYLPPAGADILLLLPCSATKPYARSKSHRVYRRILGEIRGASRIHEVIVTSPLGVVPRELELTWPAAHYDVPVTGHYDGEETAMIRAQLRALLARGGYEQVVSHLDAGTHALIADLLPPGTPHTGTPHPTDYKARDSLRETLREVTAKGRSPAWPKRRLADATAILSWQFGADAARALQEATADVSGRPPGLRLYAHEGRDHALATFVPERGLFALTLAGARVLLAAGHAKTVEIDDFTPRGTLFAVGVKDADPGIVPDDEVVLMHAGEARGVGRSRMTGDEMRLFPRGAAVEVRHHA